MLKEFKKKNIRTLSTAHKFAGFKVLKAPDIPSILVEVGFLSNKSDQKLLATKSYQNKVITSIISGLDSYFLGGGYPLIYLST